MFIYGIQFYLKCFTTPPIISDSSFYWNFRCNLIWFHFDVNLWEVVVWDCVVQIICVQSCVCPSLQSGVPYCCNAPQDGMFWSLISRKPCRDEPQNWPGRTGFTLSLGADPQKASLVSKSHFLWEADFWKLTGELLTAQPPSQVPSTPRPAPPPCSWGCHAGQSALWRCTTPAGRQRLGIWGILLGTNWKQPKCLLIDKNEQLSIHSTTWMNLNEWKMQAIKLYLLCFCIYIKLCKFQIKLWQQKVSIWGKGYKGPEESWRWKKYVFIGVAIVSVNP